jgi:hypothetical protein
MKSSTRRLTLTVYPGADGAFTLYEDDGKSFAHKRGDFMQLTMTWNEAARRFTIALAPGSRMRPPAGPGSTCVCRERDVSTHHVRRKTDRPGASMTRA